jgi:hypothetical protein
MSVPLNAGQRARRQCLPRRKFDATTTTIPAFTAADAAAANHIESKSPPVAMMSVSNAIPPSRESAGAPWT